MTDRSDAPVARASATGRPSPRPPRTDATKPERARANTNTNPSCAGAPGAGDDCAGQSCCARGVVPGGELDHVNLPAFALDAFEITVGRVRAWVKNGQPVPAVGAVITKTADGREVKWEAGWRVQTGAKLAGWARYDTWSAGRETAPKNYLSWYTAAAFCHAEGGRLPTEAEWKFAATGGLEKRKYPWGHDAPSPERAAYNCNGDGNPSCSLDDLIPVGSRPRGVGRWGHHDLAGSVFEWTVDARASAKTAKPGAPCGGGFCYIGGVDRRARTDLVPANQRPDSPDAVSHMVGARCAYDLAPEAAPVQL